jgi:hypothetical protein
VDAPLVWASLSQVSKMNARSKLRVTRFLSEFAVIVVGVLAALSVDAWRENQIDRGLERRYLEQIVSDSQENLRRISEATALEQRHLEVAESLWHAVERDVTPSADSVGAWLDRRDGSWWYSDPRLRDGTITALARTGDFALIRDPRIRSGILGYVSQLQADLVEFRRGVQIHEEAQTQLSIRGEAGLRQDFSPHSTREVRLYLVIVSDPEGRAALDRLRKGYESRIWYLGQIEGATTALLDLLG